MLFYFFMCDDLSFIGTTQNTNTPSEKNVSMPRMDGKKLYTWEFQLERNSRNMRCKLLQKRFSRKTAEFSKHFQKQPLRGVPEKRCSENMQQVYRRTPMPKCDFNKVAKQLY